MSTFTWALDLIEQGYRAARYEWLGQAYIIYVPSDPSSHQVPYVAMKTGNSAFLPWVATEEDKVATDWYQVD